MRITMDTLPGEVVVAMLNENGSGCRMTFGPDEWAEFVAAVVAAAPFGVPPALDQPAEIAERGGGTS